MTAATTCPTCGSGAVVRFDGVAGCSTCGWRQVYRVTKAPRQARKDRAMKRKRRKR